MTQRWSREALYNEVWAEPVTTVAKRYGVSGNAIAKVCKKLKIPLPGRGYWARKAHGYAVRQVALPPMKEVPTLWQPEPKPVQEKVPIDPELELINQRLSKGEFNPSAPIPKRTAQLEAVRKAIHARRKQHFDNTHLALRSDAFDLRVSNACLDRAIDVIGTIMYIASRIDASVQTKKPVNRWDKTVTVFSHDGNEVAFCVRERLRMVKNPSAAASDLNASHSLQPTGVVAFEILSYAEHLKKLWQDKPGLMIEAQIPKIMAALMKASILVRRRDEEWRRRALIAQQRKLELEQLASQISQEEEKVKVLLANSENWRLAKNVRDYIADLERSDPADQADTRAAYVKWVKDQADRIDPFTPSPPSILDRRSEVAHLLQVRR